MRDRPRSRGDGSLEAPGVGELVRRVPGVDMASFPSASRRVPCEAFVRVTGLGAVVDEKFRGEGGKRLAKQPKSRSSRMGNVGWPWMLLWLLLAGWTVRQLSSLALFMNDSRRVEFAVPSKTRELHESAQVRREPPARCAISGAWRATRLIEEDVEDVYAPGHYGLPNPFAKVEELLSPLHLSLEAVRQPPPFLLVPAMFRGMGLDFEQFRSVWFYANLVLFLVAVVTVSLWVHGTSFGSLWFAVPLLGTAPVFLNALQSGVPHLFALHLVLLAVVAIDRGQNLVCGLLVSLASAAHPLALLIFLVLILRGRVEAILTTLLGLGILVVATFLWFGPEPVMSYFQDYAIDVVRGHTRPFGDSDHPVLEEASVAGIPFKLSELGWVEPATADRYHKRWLPLAPWLLAAVAGLAAMRWGKGRRHHTSARRGLLQVTAAVWVLGNLLAPGMPWNAQAMGFLWLLTTLVPASMKGTRLLGIPAGWALTAWPLPLPFGSPSLTFDWSLGLLASATMIAVSSVVLIRGSLLPPRTG